MNSQVIRNVLVCCVGVAIFVGAPLGAIALRNAFPPVGIAPMSVSPCTNIICEEDEEPLEICWKNVSVTVLVSASPDVIAVAVDSGEYDTTVTVTVHVYGEPEIISGAYELTGGPEWLLMELSGLKPKITHDEDDWQSPGTSLTFDKHGTSAEESNG